jgi:fatty acid-binding protein DegV
MEKVIENPAEQVILIAQSNRLEQAQIYKQKIEERFHPKKVYISDVFPACGINIGSGLMAAYVFGKPISQGLTEEKALFESLNN